MVILFEVLQPVVVEPLRSAEAHNKTIVWSTTVVNTTKLTWGTSAGRVYVRRSVP
jgi:hypothetical protein